MAVVSGGRGTGNIAANLLLTDMSGAILELEPDSAPLLVLSKRASSTSTTNPKYSWWEDSLRTRFDTVAAGGALIGATVINVNNGTIWAADDLGFDTVTKEVFRVVSVATNALTVVRAVGSTAVAMAAAEELINIGSAAQEGALDKAARSNNPVEISNYTQIFRTPVDVTGTLMSTSNRTAPNDLTRQRNHAGIEHSKDIEYGGMLGRPSLDVTGTHPRRTTGGFDYFATQNISDVGGLMTEAEFFAALVAPFRYGSKTKAVISAVGPLNIINAYPKGHLQVMNPDPSLTYGIRTTQVIAPQGTLNVVTHWLLEGTNYGNQMWIVDLKNVGYRYLHGDNGSRDTHIRHDIQAPGYDGVKDEYLSECGFQYGQPLTHGKIINATS